ncbi:M12 family metallopeptidase [Sorangium sp. So ce385]|uniref:M12 family metallopeptidase n=1 Tax=Sorangium sp. So ce385 TaxID=3133308 RepID=UPI003F5C4655
MKRSKGIILSSMLVLGGGLLGAACGGDGATEVAAPEEGRCGIDSTSPECAGSLSAELGVKRKGEWRSLVVQGKNGPEELHYEVIDGKAIFEGDIVLGNADELESKGVGIRDRDLRWPNRQVPYVIDSALTPERQTSVADAIAHWEANTDFDFYAITLPTTEENYIHFINSNGCWSSVGMQEGPQEIGLGTAQSATDIVGMGIAKSSDKVYAWYNDGYVSAGSSTILDSERPLYPYTLPTGYTTADIVGISISPSDQVYAWYDDGKYSIGTSWDLDAHQGPTSYSLPPGYTVGNIRGIGIASNGRVYAWYSDGKRSAGTASDLDADLAPATFSLPPGQTVNTIAEIDISSTDVTYAWFTDRTRTSGSTTDLDSTSAAQSYTTPGGCGFGATVHEIGHAIGLWHEQSRCDRDDHLTVNTANIQSGKAHNFDKHCEGRDLYQFDWGSIMLYSSYSFSINDTSPTLVKASDGSTFSAQRTSLSAGDIRSVQELYGYSPPSSKVPGDIVAMAVASNDHIYAWYSNGTKSSGSSFDLDAHTAASSFSLPPGKTVADIIAISIAKSTDHVYAWYDDGTVSSGSSGDLDLHTSPTSFSLPPGKTISDIVEIGITPDDDVYTWYDDGTVSVGTSTDLDSESAPYAYSLPPGKTAGNIRGIDITGSNSLVYVWYSDYSLSIGTSSDLDYHRANW